MDANKERKSIKISEIFKSPLNNFSIEITPDIDKIKHLNSQPKFVAITWHASKHKCEDFNIAPLRLATSLSNEFNVMLHLSCDLLRYKYLDELLSFLIDNSIKNLFVILGENYKAEESDFKSTEDLIKYIRQKHANYFCIGIAGYPDKTDIQDLQKFKEKVNAGADFVITQAFFDTQTFKNYLSKVKLFGIDIPIVPGIFLFKNNKELLNFSRLCKVHIPEDLRKLSAENPDKSLLELQSNFINEVREMNCFRLVHYFTLNDLRLPSECI